MHLGGKDRLFIASVDVEAGFYQCGINDELAENFTLPPVDASFFRDRAMLVDLRGRPLPSVGKKVTPYLRTLPMGRTWAFWLMQKVRIELVFRAGVPRDRVALGEWPFPRLDTGVPAELPYCDKVTVLGTNRVCTRRIWDKVLKVFREAGFSMHEVSRVVTSMAVLGCQLGGTTPTSRRNGERAGLLMGALHWLASGPRVTGKQVEVIVGHYVATALFNRCGLAVMT